MAKTLKAFPRPLPSTEKYPWDTWLDGQIWRLERGKDFSSTKAVSIRGSAYQAAAYRGKKLRTQLISDDVLIVQATERNGDK